MNTTINSEEIQKLFMWDYINEWVNVIDFISMYGCAYAIFAVFNCSCTDDVIIISLFALIWSRCGDLPEIHWRARRKSGSLWQSRPDKRQGWWFNKPKSDCVGCQPFDEFVYRLQLSRIHGTEDGRNDLKWKLCPCLLVAVYCIVSNLPGLL